MMISMIVNKQIEIKNILTAGLKLNSNLEIANNIMGQNFSKFDININNRQK